MKSIRIGNDIRIVWPIVLSGDVSKLKDLDLTVEVRLSKKVVDVRNYADSEINKVNSFKKTETTILMNGGVVCRPDNGSGKECCDVRPLYENPQTAPVKLPYTIENNTLIAIWPANKQFATGDYDIVLYGRKNKGGQTVCDQYRFVRLVSHTAQIDNEDNCGVEPVITMQPTTVELSGLSAYEVAVLEGFSGTREEWVESLKQPAKDAASEAEENFKTYQLETDKKVSEFVNRKVTPEMLSESTKQLIEASGGGTITNLADDEDIESVDDGTGTNVLKFKDRAYSPSTFSGKGYKILRKNIVDGKNLLTQDMINEPNTRYVIQYDFDLNGAEITIPEGCSFVFQGGSIDSGIINTNNTFVDNFSINNFGSNIKINGGFSNNVFPAISFGIKSSNNDNTIYVQNAINFINSIGGGVLLFPKGDFYISNIELKNNVVLKGVGRRITRLQSIEGTEGVLINFPSIEKGGIYNLSINGNQADNTYILDGIHIGNDNTSDWITSRITPLCDCEITNFSNNGCVCNPKYGVYNINNCLFGSCGNIALKISCTDNLFSNIWISGSKIGLYIDGSDNKISNVKIDVCGFDTKDKDSFGVYTERSEGNLLSNVEVQATYGNAYKFNNNNNYNIINCISFGNGLIYSDTQEYSTTNFHFYNCKNCFALLNVIEQDYVRRNLYDVVIENQLSTNNIIFLTSNMGKTYIGNIEGNNNVINTPYINSINNINCLKNTNLKNIFSNNDFTENIRASLEYINKYEYKITSDNSDSDHYLRKKIDYSFIKGHSYFIGCDYKTDGTLYFALQNIEPFVNYIGVYGDTSESYQPLGAIKAFDTSVESLYLILTISKNAITSVKNIKIIDVTDIVNIGFSNKEIINQLNSSIYDFNDVSINGILDNIINYGLNKINYGDSINKIKPTKLEIGFQYFNTTLNKPVWWTGSKWVDATGADV